MAQQSIFINEFLIEPTPQSVELFNAGQNPIDISHWYIDDNGGTTYFTIPDNSILYPNSCLVFTSEFNLNRTSADTIRLFDATAPPTSNISTLIDSFSYKSSSGSAITYMRIPDGNNHWATGPATLSKFNGTDTSCTFSPSPTPTPQVTLHPSSGQAETVTPTPTITVTIPMTPTPIRYDNILLSEVMVNPETGDNEWIELFNNNQFDVDLTDWFIDDMENAGSTPKQFSMHIASQSYGIFEINSSIFNNSGDTVRLLDSNKIEKDSFEYTNTSQGITRGRINWESQEFCEQEPSKGLLNNSCISDTIPEASSPTPLISNRITPAKTLPSNILGVSTIKPTLKPASSINQLIKVNQPSTTLTDQKNLHAQEIVSNTIQSHKPNQHNRALSKSLSFSSFSFTLLSLISMIFKIKGTIV